MKQKLILFAMAAILLASCASNKKVARAYEDGRKEGKDITENLAKVRMNQVMDSMAQLKETVIHDTVTKIVNVGGSTKKPTDEPSKEYVFQANFSLENFIGYPELNGKFYRVSPVYTDSTRHYDQTKKVYFNKYEKKKFDIYIPIEDYNIIKQKGKKIVTIYASWMKLCGNEMHSFDFKGSECIDVLGGIHYSDPGVKIDFKPAKVKEEVKTEPGDNKTKIDPKKVVDLKDIGPCSNPPDCTLLWPKTLNLETCNCE